MGRGLTFACSVALDGALHVHVGHYRKAALQGRDYFGGGFWTTVFARMQNGKKNASVSDGFLRAVQSTIPEQKSSTFES